MEAGVLVVWYKEAPEVAMTRLKEFVDKVRIYGKVNPLHRYGQACFNVLLSEDSFLANNIRSGPCDPFFAAEGDEKIVDFWKRLEKEWVD